MNQAEKTKCIAFAGARRIAAGHLEDVALATKLAIDSGTKDIVLIFDYESQQVELDFRGSIEDFKANLHQQLGTRDRKIPPTEEPTNEKSAQPGPGRPKLGVIAREVTLLPRQWDWLNSQPGGASVTLRKLVDAARKSNESLDQKRRAREICYRFMSAMAGNASGFEEACRALFANDQVKFERLVSSWENDLAQHVMELSKSAFD